MKIFNNVWPWVVWFLLAMYVILRVLAVATQIDIIFAAWLGGVVSVFCVLVIVRQVKQARTSG